MRVESKKLIFLCCLCILPDLMGADISSCREVFNRLLSNYPVTNILNRKFAAKYYGHPDTRKIVEAIKELKSISMMHPFEFDGNAKEKNGVLIISLEGIGPAVNPSKGLFNSITEMKGAMAGLVVPFVQSPELNPTFVKGLMGVVEGVEGRLATNPELKEIVIRTKDVQNIVLRELLRNRFGFKVTSWKTTGMCGSAACMELRMIVNRDEALNITTGLSVFPESSSP